MASGQLKLHVTLLNDLVPTVAVTALIKCTLVLPESTAHTSSNRTVGEWSGSQMMKIWSRQGYWHILW